MIIRRPHITSALGADISSC